MAGMSRFYQPPAFLYQQPSGCHQIKKPVTAYLDPMMMQILLNNKVQLPDADFGLPFPDFSNQPKDYFNLLRQPLISTGLLIVGLSGNTKQITEPAQPQ